MYVSNTTFMLSAPIAARCVEYLRSELKPAAFATEHGPRSVRFMELRDIRGGVEMPDGVRSIALQADFASRADLEDWNSRCLEPAIRRFGEAFGSEEIAMTTVLEDIEI